MEDWLNTFINKINKKIRKVILFLDNVTGHLHLHLSNVRLAWLSDNTSDTQLMNQGIIYSVKVYYSKMVLQLLLANMDNIHIINEFSNKIN